jgi:hypothetical protein
MLPPSSGLKIRPNSVVFFLLDTYMIYFYSLKMNVVYFSETSVITYRAAAQHCTPEDNTCRVNVIVRGII